MTTNELFEQAKAEIANLHKGETFSLKDLFKGYEWKRIKQGDKSTLGTLFLNFARTEQSLQVDKKNNNSFYTKVL